jgi:hypothetical protein
MRASAKETLRRVPGLVGAKRASVAAFRRMRPLRPPVESPELVERMLVTPEDETYITGNGFAAHCRYLLNYDSFRVDERVADNWWFCNPEFIEYFFRTLAPDEPYVLFTHNSNVDRPIDGRFRKRLERPELVAWFATNVELRHPKLFSIPVGVGNPIKCDISALARVRAEGTPKAHLFEASFDVRTNLAERLYCIEQTGIEPEPKRGWTEYFTRLASSYFCISPAGNGVDCYRTWQALYLGAVPVVTRSVLTDQHPDLPMLVLDDWSEFREIDFSAKLYERTWGEWSPEQIRLDRYLERVRTAVAEPAVS